MRMYMYCMIVYIHAVHLYMYDVYIIRVQVYKCVYTCSLLCVCVCVCVGVDTPSQEHCTPPHRQTKVNLVEGVLTEDREGEERLTAIPDRTQCECVCV